MVHRTWMAALTLAAVVGVAGGAWAEMVLPTTLQTTPVGRGYVYFGLGAEGLAISLPRFEYVEQSFFDEDTDPRPFRFLLSVHPVVVGGGPVGTIGYVFHPGVLPAWLGERPRVETTLGYYRGEGHNNVSAAKVANIRITSIDGTAVYTNDDFLLTTVKLKTTIESFNGVLQLRSDYRLTPSLTLSPLIGVMGTSSETTFHATTRFTDANDNNDDVLGSIKETINYSRIGGQIGADLSYRINDAWTLYGGVVGMLFHQHSALDGRDCLSDEVPAGTLRACNAGEEGFATRVRATDNRTAGRVSLNTGFSYSLGWGALSVSVVAAYDTDTPGVRSQKALLEDDTDTPRPATLRFSGQWSAGGFIYLLRCA